MTDDKQDVEGSKAGDPKSEALVLRRPGPEMGPGGFKSWIRDWVVQVIFDNLPKGMAAIGQRIAAGDLAALKALMEIAHRLEDSREDTDVVLQSFAELLITEVKSLPAETGDGAGTEVPADA